MSAPLLSVVIPTYNRKDSLRRLLNSLAAQELNGGAFEAIVVDDGSSDGTREMVAALSVPFALSIHSQENAGPGAARNRGMQHARGALIVFLDDDVVAPPGLLAAHAARHDAASGQVVIGPMLPPDGWRRPAWIRWEEDKLLRQYRAMERGDWECTARQFYTGNASLSRALFLEEGGFDVRLRRAEDVELAYRLARRGARFVYAPEAGVLHYPTRSFASWRRTPYQYGRNDVLMERERQHGTVQNATRELRTRHPLNRWLTHVTSGRPRLAGVLAAALTAFVYAADALRLGPPASAALSALFHLLYWRGISDELGSA